MGSVLKWARGLTRRAPLIPLHFPTSGFKVIENSVPLEEEHFDEFRAGQYYPVNIGDVLASTYQVVGKLGFGTTSTVWLARNLVYVPQDTRLLDFDCRPNSQQTGVMGTLP